MEIRESFIDTQHSPICPICGEETDLFYINDESEIIGCQNCASVVDAWHGEKRKSAEKYLKDQISTNDMRYRKALKRKDIVAAENLLKKREIQQYILEAVKAIKI